MSFLCRVGFHKGHPSRTLYCYPQQAPEHHKKTTGPRASTKKHNTKKNFAPTTKNRHNQDPPQKKHATKKCYNPLHKKTVTTRKTHRTTKTPQQHTPQTHTTNTALTVKATPRHPSRNTTTLSTRPARRRQAQNNKKNRGAQNTHGGSRNTPPSPNKTNTQRTLKETPTQPKTNRPKPTQSD